MLDDRKEILSILLDLHKLAGYVYRKGYADAASFCNPIHCDEFANREDNHSEIRMLKEFNGDPVDPIIYCDLLQLYSNIIKAKYLNVYLRYKSTEGSRESIAYLMDCVYREAVNDGKAGSIAYAKMQMAGEDGFSTIEVRGVKIPIEQWNDTLKYYVGKVEAHHKSIGLKTGMSNLYKFFNAGIRVHKMIIEANERKRLEREMEVFSKIYGKASDSKAKSKRDASPDSIPT